MLPTTARIETLRSVSIFADTVEDTLVELADLIEESSVSAGETIIQRGELGYCLFIIVDGQVRVHDGDRTLNFLGAQDVFGEMAALDPEPRMATVTAVEDTHLFRLDREPLARFMATHSEITHGVFHVLCGRLRARSQDLVEDFTYMQQLAKVTAAASAIEAGVYVADSLDDVGRRSDALGQLARVVQRMAREVGGREQRLKQEVQQLRIEIDQRKAAHQAAEITTTDYFQRLQVTAGRLRRARNEGNRDLNPPTTPDR